MSNEESRFVNQECLDLNELEIEERWISKEFKSIYDGYTLEYNSKKEGNRRSYTSRLMNLHDGFSRKSKGLSKEIDTNLKRIFWELDTFNQVLWDRKFNDECMDNEDEVESKINVLKASIDILVDILKEGTDYVNGKQGELNSLIKNYKRFFETLDNSERNHSKHFNHLQRLFEDAIECSRFVLHTRALNEATDEIGLKNYPKEISSFESLDETKKERLRDNSTDYGFHQNNAKWVDNRFWELAEKSEKSQNKRAEQIQSEYKEKYGIKISKAHIYRFAEVHKS